MTILSICHLRDGRLVIGDRSGKMIVWNKNLTYTKELKQHNATILSIKQLKDGRICSVLLIELLKFGILILEDCMSLKNVLVMSITFVF